MISLKFRGFNYDKAPLNKRLEQFIDGDTIQSFEQVVVEYFEEFESLKKFSPFVEMGGPIIQREYLKSFIDQTDDSTLNQLLYFVEKKRDKSNRNYFDKIYLQDPTVLKGYEKSDSSEESENEEDKSFSSHVQNPNFNSNYSLRKRKREEEIGKFVGEQPNNKK
jgi:hypothetical protein